MSLTKSFTLSRLALAVVSVAACSEARSSDDAAMDVPAVTDIGAVDVANADASDGPISTDVVSNIESVTINEIRATGDDWIELFNRGTTSVDLSGMRIADSEDGGPRLAAAVVFPSGTVLLPGAYILVVGNYGDAGTTVTSGCLDGGGGPCVQGTWGISASRGETVFLVTPDGRIVEQATYGADAVPSGQSYGRLPNGTGAFAANAPTPGSENHAP
jgi:hypothetical protein